MSTVVPPSSTPPPPPPTQAGQSHAAAIVLKAPPTLIQSIPQGQAVQATVAQTPQPNQVQVQTALGSVTLQSVMTLPKGAVLTLVLSNLQPPMFQIAMVDGKPVPGALTAAQAKAAGLPLPAPGPAGEAVTLQAGTKVAAVLLRPAQAAPTIVPQAAAPGGQAQPTVQAGTSAPPSGATQASPPTLTGTPQTAQTGQATATTGAAPTTPASPPATTPATVLTSTAAATVAKSINPSAPNILPSGTRFAVTVTNVESPSTVITPQPGATTKGITPGQTVIGTVIGRTPQGQPIVQSPNATVTLDTKALLVDGAKVTFRIETSPTLPAPSSAAQNLRQAGMGMGLVNAKGWDDYGEALKALAGLDPARFQNVIQTALPQPGAKLNNQILFFLSALKGGDLKSLLGDTATRLLTKERPGLMGRLGADFKAMSTLSEQPQSGDWRLALIPMWNGERLEQVRLYQKNAGGGDDEDGAEDDETRFILDLDLSNLGHLQIDGLMMSSKNRLDLILRTEQPLPEDMHRDIIDISAAALELLGLTASISFQARPEDFVQFPPNAPPQQGLLA